MSYLPLRTVMVRKIGVSKVATDAFAMIRIEMITTRHWPPPPLRQPALLLSRAKGQYVRLSSILPMTWSASKAATFLGHTTRRL
jgi:hypothetical protein